MSASGRRLLMSSPQRSGTATTAAGDEISPPSAVAKRCQHEVYERTHGTLDAERSSACVRSSTSGPSILGNSEASAADRRSASEPRRPGSARANARPLARRATSGRLSVPHSLRHPVPFTACQTRAASIVSVTSTSSPTRKPPVSSAAFQVRPKSLRLSRIDASNATRSFAYGHAPSRGSSPAAQPDD